MLYCISRLSKKAAERLLDGFSLNISVPKETADLVNAPLKEEVFLPSAKENAGIAALCRGFLTKADAKKTLLV